MPASQSKDELERLFYERALDTTADAVSDAYLGGEALADQTPNGSVVTFTFTQPMFLIWVKPTGGSCRVDPFGGTPTSGSGVPCDDGVPNPLTIKTNTLKVYAAAGVTVAVWGYRY